jgi:hypothetical protein
MVELSIRQIEVIKRDIGQANIFFSHLQDDLIDHVCCDVEYEMQAGLTFEMAYQKVRSAIGINGLRQIQENTLLLIDKNYRIMKTTMKIAGTIAPILLAFAALFKIEHWPGAGIMLVLGFFILTFFLLPSAVYVNYREVSNKTRLLAHISGLIAAILVSVGFLFKIQHWPGAGWLLLTGMSAAALVYLPAVIIGKYHQKGHSYLIFALIGGIAFLAGVVFKMSHWPGASILNLAGSLLLFGIAFPMYIYQEYKHHETVSRNFIFFIIVCFWIVIPMLMLKMNLSADYMKNFWQAEKENRLILQHLSDKNQLLYQQIHTKTSDKKLVQTIDKIRYRTDSLYQYINQVKRDVIYANTPHVNQTGDINLEDLPDAENNNQARTILFERKEAEKIRLQIDSYREFLVSNITQSSNTTDFINQMLSTSIHSLPGRDASWETYKLWSSSVITTINRLSNLQENIRLAEREALVTIQLKMKIEE